jgi:Flp pilus assembly protein TadD
MPRVRCAEVISLCISALLLAGTFGLAHPAERDEQHRGKAVEHARRGDTAAAIEELKQIRKPSADDHSFRGELLIQLGRPQFDNADQAFHQALKLDARTSRALYGLGLLAMFQKRFAEAEGLFRKALQFAPNAPHPQNGLAGALMYQAKYAEAEALLVRLEADPVVSAMATGNLGELYLRQGKLDMAETKLKAALARQPNNFDWHRHLGEVYRLRGQNRAAAVEYRKTLDLLKRSPAADKPLLEEISHRLQEVER